MNSGLSGLIGRIGRIGLITVAAMVLSGCVGGNQVVPSTTIKWNPATGAAEIKAPKNSQIEELNIQRSGTNVSIVLRKAKFANDPDIVGAAYRGQAEMLREGLSLGKESLREAVELMKPQREIKNEE